MADSLHARDSPRRLLALLAGPGKKVEAAFANADPTCCSPRAPSAFAARLAKFPFPPQGSRLVLVQMSYELALGGMREVALAANR